MVDTKKDPPISASAHLALNLVSQNVNNDKVNYKTRGTRLTKRKINGDLLSKKKILEKDGDVFDTLGCLPGELNLEEEKSIQPVKLCATGDYLVFTLDFLRLSKFPFFLMIDLIHSFLHYNL